jgi:hypothetical protein
VRFNNRFCALLEIPDLPSGAFEHIGDRKIKPQGGGGSWDPSEVAKDTVSSVTDFVQDPVGTITDTLDKADNWTEGAGELLADIDPGPAIGDAGEWIDQSIIQPALDDPLATVATVAAVATQQYWALPIIAGTATAARGGDLEDIAKSVGVAFVAAQAAPYVSQAMPAGTTIGGKIASSAATGAVLGAGGGASSAILVM